jgi:hypothetical protein
MTHVTIERAKLENVLEALEKATRYGAGGFEDAKDSIKQALAAPTVQEPVGYVDVVDGEYVGVITGEVGWEERLYTTPQAAQPAPVPLTDEPKKLFGYEIWNRFYRSKEELLQEMVRSNSGYPKDWIEANIRDVYVHGIPTIETHRSITQGQP